MGHWERTGIFSHAVMCGGYYEAVQEAMSQKLEVTPGQAFAV